LKVPDWFAPKRFGIGAGKPISWQGWLLTAGYVFLAIAAALLLQKSLLAFLALLIPATLAFLVIAAVTTRGGWRWRWGKGD
jgi:hypothetical protein